MAGKITKPEGPLLVAHTPLPLAAYMTGLKVRELRKLVENGEIEGHYVTARRMVVVNDSVNKYLANHKAVKIRVKKRDKGKDGDPVNTVPIE